MRRTATLAVIVSIQVLIAPALRAAPPSAAAKERAAEADAGADKTLVLDRTACLSQFTEYGLMRIDTGLLKSEGKALLGDDLGRLERTVKRLLRPRNIDWDKTDWRDVAVYHFPSIQTGDDSLALRLLPTKVPPADWAEPGFDDSSFLRAPLGTLTPVTPSFGAARERSSVHRRGLYIRTYFQVPDPTAAGDLTLTLTFRGGARVLVNGREVARSHLPAGAVTPETLADGYPTEAYIATAEERHPKSNSFIGDLRCHYDGGAKHFRYDGDYRAAYGNWSAVNRAGWQRLRKARDRVLGPVTIPSKLLVAGANVLAIELRSATYNPVIIPGASGTTSGWWISSCAARRARSRRRTAARPA